MTCTLAVQSPAQWLLQQAGQLNHSIEGLRMCSSLSPSLRGAMLLLFPARLLCISMLDFSGKNDAHKQTVVPVLPQASSLRSGSSLPGSAGMKVTIMRLVYSALRGAAVHNSQGQAI